MTDWRGKAACTAEQDHLFFPPDDDYSEEKTREAKKICSTCPVRVECAIWATDNKLPYGVWGRSTPKERGLKNPKPVPIEEEVNPNLCAGGCGHVMPRYIMATLEFGQRNYYAKGRCRQCYERDVYAGDITTTQNNNGWLDGFKFGRQK